MVGNVWGSRQRRLSGELKRAIETTSSYATALDFPLRQVLLRLDGLYGDAAPLSELLTAALGMIARSKDYRLLDLQAVQKRLCGPADQQSKHPESGMSRALYDCPQVPLSPRGPEVHLIVATHPVTSSPPSVGVQREATVYKLFVCTLPSAAFTPSDVLDLYLHRGSFEPVLADEDQEQEPDRWCSRTPHGQEFWQIVSQWVWNLRLELGQQLSIAELRTTEFAKAEVGEPAVAIEPAPISPQTPQGQYGPAHFARPSFTGGFPGSAFTPQPDGTLRCPADHPLYPQERRPERDGSLRVLYAARIVLRNQDFPASSHASQR
jgi:hypothetical protein